MAQIEYGPPQQPPADYINQTGQAVSSGQPTIATDEQNQRVRLILDALNQGMAPNVPHAGGLTPEYSQAATGGQPVTLGQTPFGLSGYHAEQKQPQSPASQHEALLNALRTNPAQTMQALSQLATQMKGMPAQMQQPVLQGLGVMPPERQPLTPMGVQAAAAGVPGQGLTQQQAQATMNVQAQQAAQTDAAKKMIEDAVKGTAKLGLNSRLYYNEYGDQAPASMTVNEAEQRGYTPHNPKAIDQIPAAKSVYFTTEELRKLLPKVLVKVQQQEENLPPTMWYTRFLNIQKNRIAIDILRKAGDPDVRQFDQFVQAGLVRYLMALGIPGGRDTAALLQRMAVEYPDSHDGLEAAKAVLDNVDNIMYEASGVRRKPNTKSQVPSIRDSKGTKYIKMGNNWYIDPNQGD